MLSIVISITGLSRYLFKRQNNNKFDGFIPNVYLFNSEIIKEPQRAHAFKLFTPSLINLSLFFLAPVRYKIINCCYN